MLVQCVFFNLWAQVLNKNTSIKRFMTASKHMWQSRAHGVRFRLRNCRWIYTLWMTFKVLNILLLLLFSLLFQWCQHGCHGHIFVDSSNFHSWSHVLESPQGYLQETQEEAKLNCILDTGIMFLLFNGLFKLTCSGYL